MSANPNWARWIFASLSKYLKQVASDNSIPAMTEGVDTRTDAILKQPDHVEIAITGPYIREVSHNYYHTKVGVRILILSQMGTDNRYAPQRIAGLFQEALDGAIATYRYGNLPEDDGTLLGCLSALNGSNDAVRVMHFGQISPTEGLRQSMVDCWYEMELQNNT
jgi:hypothetical protein